jgi:hypothetical protein
MSKRECKHGVWYTEITGSCKDCRIEELEGANSRYHAKLDAAEEVNKALDFSWEQAKRRWHKAEATIERIRVIAEYPPVDKAILEELKP